MHTHRRLVALAGVAALLLVGCAGDDPGDVAASTSSTTVDSTTSSTALEDPTTSTSSTSTVPGPGASGCDSAEGPVPPTGATDVSEVSADVDGDGAPDRVVAYREADGNRRVAVELAAGGTAAVDASESSIDGPAPLSVLGGVDLGGDGQTVLAVTSAGASVVVVGLFQFVECALARVSLEGGQPAELPVGGGVTHGDGLACTDESLVRLSATSTDGETFSTTDTRYRVDGNTLVEIGAESATLTRGSDDAELERYSTIDCPGLEREL
ncbi:hypothetical protein BH20ACT1_BH20ACT1_05290 [soil metagenome]